MNPPEKKIRPTITPEQRAQRKRYRETLRAIDEHGGIEDIATVMTAARQAKTPHQLDERLADLAAMAQQLSEDAQELREQLDFDPEATAKDECSRCGGVPHAPGAECRGEE